MEISMAKSIYRTAQGKQVNLDALRVTNEETVAIGNMNVNARGDEVDSRGKIIKPKGQVMKEFYNDGVRPQKAPNSFSNKIIQERERSRQERLKKG